MAYQVILVGFLPNDNGRSCGMHPFGCGNALVLERDDNTHGVGMKLRMRLVDKTHLAAYQVLPDRSDGCRVCFAAREFAVGARGQSLDGCMVVIKEMVLPDDGTPPRGNSSIATVVTQLPKCWSDWRRTKNQPN